MKKKGHTSVPYGSGTSKKAKESQSVNESEIKTIHDLLFVKYGKNTKNCYTDGDQEKLQTCG